MKSPLRNADLVRAPMLGTDLVKAPLISADLVSAPEEARTMCKPVRAACDRFA